MAATKERPDGLDSPVTGKVIKYMAKAQVAAFKATNGRIACVAHHVIAPDRDLVWHLRYADDYAQVDGSWLLARRELTIDLIETRPLKRSR